jgi:RHS repeat-associated protein
VVNDQNQYDGNGLLIASSDSYGTTTYAYTANGLIQSITKGGVTWQYTYDATFPTRVATIIPFEGGIRSTKWPGWKYEYYAPSVYATSRSGALSAVKRYRNDNTTLDTWATYIYDSAGRVTSTNNEDGFASSYSYNAAGDKISSAEPYGPSTTYDYDSIGRITKITDLLQHATTYMYDLNDRIKSVTLPPPAGGLGFTTTYLYDQYDSATNLVFTNVTDPNGRVTKQGYDPLGHLVRTIDALNNTTTYAYQFGLLHTITDANGNVTQYDYDSNRSLQKTTFPDGASETYTAAAVDGVVTAKVDRRGIGTAYQYDAFGRIARIDRGSDTNHPIRYQYDGRNLQYVTDYTRTPAAQHQFTYDSAFRLNTETSSEFDPNCLNNCTPTSREKLTYAYNGGVSSLLASYKLEPPSGVTGPTQLVEYGYATGGRVNSITWSDTNNSSNLFAIDYTPTGQYQKITYPSGQTRTYSYDGMDRLVTLANAHPTAGEIATFTYGYDENWTGQPGTFLGQRTSVTVSAPAAANQAVGLTKYWYDANYQLVRAEYPSPAGYQAWTYDAIGNRTWDSTYGNYTYYKNGTNSNNGQRLKAGAGFGDHTYDANGNDTGYTGTPLYTWDNANRLTTAAGTAYTYDYDGRRVAATTSSLATRYVPLDFNTVAERAPGIARDYVFAPGIDEPLAKINYSYPATPAISYYGADGIGSIVTVTDADGAIQNGFSYASWGIGGGSELFGYTGRETAVNGLWNYRARYYQPSTGRFLSEDPMRFVDDPSPYFYVNNDPTDYIDMLGLWPLGMPGKDKVAGKLPEFLTKLFPSLTPAEIRQLTKDAIDELNWHDVRDANKITDFKKMAPPKKPDDLTKDQRELLKKFLDRLPPRDKTAVDKVKKACTPPTPPPPNKKK